MKIKLLKSLSLANILTLIAVLAFPMVYFTQKAQAAGLTQSYVRLDRMTTGIATGGVVCAKPATVDVETMVKVTFPTGFGVAGPNTAWVVDNAIPAGSTFWTGMVSGTTTASTVSGQSVTFPIPSGDPAVGTLYCLHFTGTATLTNPAIGGGSTYSDGAIVTEKAGPTPIDSSVFALAIVASDQVQVNGTVLPTFSFTLSATSANFSTAIGNAVVDVTTAPTVTITTNAKNGWTAWVKDGNNGTLNSANATANIPIPQAVGLSSIDLGTKSGPGAFGLGVTVSGGSATADAAYNGASAGYAGTLSNAFRPMSSSAAVASSDVTTLRPRAIASVTQPPASDYTDLLTVVAAGQF